MDKVENLGQVFTPDMTVDRMLKLRRNTGAALEPSAGDGAFWRKMTDCIGIELDASVCLPGCINMDFFEFCRSRKFKTIIGNPPYVAYKHIPDSTKRHLNGALGEKANLYLHFILKCLDHLEDGGELIFITPREFINATSSRKLNQRLYAEGTITHFFDEGDARIFDGAQPNCCIWRFEKGNLSRKTETYSGVKSFVLLDGQLLFMNLNYAIKLSSVFTVKVGAASGSDEIFGNPEGNNDFVYSATRKTGKVRRMIYDDRAPHPLLLPHKEALKNRKIRAFTDHDWWHWGRPMVTSNAKRVYVNNKTRAVNPFFCHPCNNWDGSVLALFLNNQSADSARLAQLLNEKVDWNELGFKVGGRYVFNQKSLQNTLLPEAFRPYCGKDSIPFFPLGRERDDIIDFQE